MPGDENPEDDFEELLRRMLGGGGQIDPAQFERLTGMPLDPAMMAMVQQQLRGAMAAGDGIPWGVAEQQALQLARAGGLSVTDGDRVDLDGALTLASALENPQDFVFGLPDPVVIDEVQRAPEIFLPIKLSVDQDRRPGRFTLTGSADVLLLPRVADS
ncbi:MAG: hypothetical protein Q7T17_00340, partial [Microbacterium sp.]|uniref:AAA family ATPase n=1 Tax=Microbacterium sp. TaxID=51671 RepID=UPI00271F4184|nr:hypothetical protein [Microbacterium sp.]